MKQLKIHQPIKFYKGIKFVGPIPCVRKMTVKDCKLGLSVLTFSGSLFKVEQILQNEKRPNDLTITVGNGVNGSMYGSYNGTFNSIYINKD